MARPARPAGQAKVSKTYSLPQNMIERIRQFALEKDVSESFVIQKIVEAYFIAKESSDGGQLDIFDMLLDTRNILGFKA